MLAEIEGFLMRLLVTGGSGFIGSSLIRHIIKNSEHQCLEHLESDEDAFEEAVVHICIVYI